MGGKKKIKKKKKKIRFFFQQDHLDLGEEIEAKRAKQKRNIILSVFDRQIDKQIERVIPYQKDSLVKYNCHILEWHRTYNEKMWELFAINN